MAKIVFANMDHSGHTMLDLTLDKVYSKTISMWVSPTSESPSVMPTGNPNIPLFKILQMIIFNTYCSYEMFQPLTALLVIKLGHTIFNWKVCQKLSWKNMCPNISKSSIWHGCLFWCAKRKRVLSTSNS